MSSFLAILRNGAWLTAERTRIYSRMFAVGALICVLYAGQLSIRQAFGPQGRPQATDFVTFWAGAKLATAGQPALVYDIATFTEAENRGGALGKGGYLPYFYPPPFLLLSLPLAIFPYLLAQYAFLAGFTALLAALLYRFLPRAWAILPVLAGPASLINWLNGQNGCLNACFFAGALLTLDRAPLLGGALLGLLVTKPHLAIGIPFVLLAARRWRAFWACGLAATGLVLASWALFGTATWLAFWHITPEIRSAFEDHPEDWRKLISVSTAVRLCGASLALGYAAQALTALATLAVVIKAGWRRPDGPTLVALMVAASMLCSPHMMDYDMVCLAVPMVWLLARAQIDGWRPWEKTALFVLYLLPLITRMVAVNLHAPLTPPLLIALLLLVAARAHPSRVVRP